MNEPTLTQKLLKLIDRKIEQIESYAISTQEAEEQYIHEINCLIETKFLLKANNENN
jgi:hypothetical protein|tara:strand:- start:5628 stop:5798 length:171 start_codon:yes stop_codon:yes gene_type:complete